MWTECYFDRGKTAPFTATYRQRLSGHIPPVTHKSSLRGAELSTGTLYIYIIDLALDRDRWPALVNAVMNLLVP